jgi:hypothetical protein
MNEQLPGIITLKAESSVRHRTRPVGTRSVNLTVELAQTETIEVNETQSRPRGGEPFDLGEMV